MAQEKTVQQCIIDYVSEKTKGMVQLRPQHANHIVELVLARDDRPIRNAVAKKYVYSAMNKTYVHYRTIQTTDAQITRIIKEALDAGPVDSFYKYELYNSAGNFESFVYTANANLFD